MRWIVDSGGTKSSWINRDGLVENFSGVNPNIHSKEFINSVLSDAFKALAISKSDTIVWYGAGCSAVSSVDKLKECFSDLGVQNVEIQHDLLAACRAVLGSEYGIVGILGTGSNACLYDGNSIVKEKISLGYVMGDEGGGAYFGKRLLQDYVNDTMPEDERNIFQAHFPEDGQTLVSNFYSSPTASAHLGQFAKVLNHFPEKSRYKGSLLKSGFEAYKDLFVQPLNNSRVSKIGFVGTVASIYEEQLKGLFEGMGLEFAGVCQNPIQDLLKWHNAQDATQE